MNLFKEKLEVISFQKCAGFSAKRFFVLFFLFLLLFFLFLFFCFLFFFQKIKKKQFATWARWIPKITLYFKSV